MDRPILTPEQTALIIQWMNWEIQHWEKPYNESQQQFIWRMEGLQTDIESLTEYQWIRICDDFDQDWNLPFEDHDGNPLETPEGNFTKDDFEKMEETYLSLMDWWEGNN